MEYNGYVDLKDISDSMLLDSDTCIAELTDGAIKCTLEVRGLVTVNTLLTDEKGNEFCETYRHASEMPEWLLDAIRDGSYLNRDDIAVNENNWFELFYDFENEYHTSVVVDVENMDAKEIESFMHEALNDYIKDEMVTISDIEWDWDEDMLWDKITEMDDINEVCELFEIPPEAITTKDDYETAFDLAYDNIRHNKVSVERAFGLPETLVVPKIYDDEWIGDYISDEYGFCIMSFVRSDDMEKEEPEAER